MTRRRIRSDARGNWSEPRLLLPSNQGLSNQETNHQKLAIWDEKSTTRALASSSLLFSSTKPWSIKNGKTFFLTSTWTETLIQLVRAGVVLCFHSTARALAEQLVSVGFSRRDWLPSKAFSFCFNSNNRQLITMRLRGRLGGIRRANECLMTSIECF